MANGFPRDQVDELLKACHRRCCVCHRFCGVKIETDHIVPKAEGGPDTIDNAIPVCFECHAEIHSYNDKHPRGRKFRPNELRGHKEQWLAICRNRPDIFVETKRDSDVGPLQALIDELEFNRVVSHQSPADQPGCPFLDEQFRRAIREGAIAILQETLKQSIIEAYVVMGRANQFISAALQAPRGTNLWHEPAKAASETISQAAPKIETARDGLLEFLASE